MTKLFYPNKQRFPQLGIADQFREVSPDIALLIRWELFSPSGNHLWLAANERWLRITEATCATHGNLPPSHYTEMKQTICFQITYYTSFSIIFKA